MVIAHAGNELARDPHNPQPCRALWASGRQLRLVTARRSQSMPAHPLKDPPEALAFWSGAFGPAALTRGPGGVRRGWV